MKIVQGNNLYVFTATVYFISLVSLAIFSFFQAKVFIINLQNDSLCFQLCQDMMSGHILLRFCWTWGKFS